MCLAARQKGHIESDGKVFHQHLESRCFLQQRNLSTRALHLGLSMRSVLLLTFYFSLLVRLYRSRGNLSHLPSHWYYLFVVNIFSHAVCKHSMPVDVIWKPASRVFPSSVKYHHRDSPALLAQSMERYTSAGTFREAAGRQTTDVNDHSGENSSGSSSSTVLGQVS